jgi:pimeloyl-ACP methyl ester carboxylesterase
LILKKIFWEAIDAYAVNDINKRKSKKAQFFFNPQISSFEFPSLTTPLNIEVQCTSGIYEIGKIIFESALGNVEIDYKKNLKKQTKSIIMIHGWKQDSFNRFDNILLEYFTRRNYNVYYFTLPFHMRRKSKTELFDGEYFISSNINRTVEAINQSIRELIILTRFIRSTTIDEIIVIGLSLGGMISNLLCTYENKIDRLISILYPNKLSYLIYNTPIAKYIKKDLEINGIYEKELSKLWGGIVPSERKPLTKEILLFSGTYDKFIPIFDPDELWESWDRPKRIILECGHSGIVILKNKIKSHIVNFIEGE